MGRFARSLKKFGRYITNHNDTMSLDEILALDL